MENSLKGTEQQIWANYVAGKVYLQPGLYCYTARRCECIETGKQPVLWCHNEGSCLGTTPRKTNRDIEHHDGTDTIDSESGGTGRNRTKTESTNITM